MRCFIAGIMVAILGAFSARAASLKTLVSFDGSSAAYPQAGLTADASGNLFGTTVNGGASGYGAAFEIAKTPGGYASRPTILASFSGGNGDSPIGGLIADASGNLFGTTFNGTIFEIAKTSGGYTSTPTTLASLNNPGGAHLFAGLTADGSGNLFGTTYDGGSAGSGTVFEVAKTSGGYASTPTTLVSFNGGNGANPIAGLIADGRGNLFGTTQTGGASGAGTVFEITKKGGSYASTPTTLASFDDRNGGYPNAGLIADASGSLFGTTNQGGPGGYGTVFKIAKTSGGYASTPTTLASFNNTNGAYPYASLIADASGNLFGTTLNGGAWGEGAVFKIAETADGYDSTPTVLASFSNNNGAYPFAGLIADASGNLLGTTYEGGAFGGGTVFELTDTGFEVATTDVPEPATLGLLTTGLAGFAVSRFRKKPHCRTGRTKRSGMNRFDGNFSKLEYLMRTFIAVTAVTILGASGGHAASITTLASFDYSNGAEPMAGLTADASGNLFGTTYNGTIFEIAKTSGGYASTPSTVASFKNTSGVHLYAGLTADGGGNLFGTTYDSGPAGYGTVFEVAKTSGGYASTPATLVSFNRTNGAYPSAGVIADSAGNLFGTTQAGGPFTYGTVFQIAKTAGGYASTPTTLASFNNTNGAFLSGSLVADASGNLFGTTQNGGASGAGTVFEIAKTAGGYASTPATLDSFNASNGRKPYAGLIADASGNLFGTTANGGASDAGTVFEIVKTAHGYASTPTTLASFNGSNGRSPYAGLTADAGGNLFGTTYGGGSFGDGAVFEISKTASGYASTPTILVSFNNSNGDGPVGGLIADASGNLFGTTEGGGPSGWGTVFELTGTDFQISATTADVPEPATLGVLVTGLAGLGIPYFRRRTAAE